MLLMFSTLAANLLTESPLHAEENPGARVLNRCAGKKVYNGVPHGRESARLTCFVTCDRGNVEPVPAGQHA